MLQVVFYFNLFAFTSQFLDIKCSEAQSAEKNKNTLSILSESRPPKVGGLLCLLSLLIVGTKKA